MNELIRAILELDVYFKHPTKGVEAVQKICRLRQTTVFHESINTLVDELADAVDAAAADIGGCRSHRAILDDLKVAVLTS